MVETWRFKLTCTKCEFSATVDGLGSAVDKATEHFEDYENYGHEVEMVKVTVFTNRE